MLKHRRVVVVGLAASVLVAAPGCSLIDKAQSGLRSASSAASSAASAASSAGSPTSGASNAPKKISDWTADKLTQAFAAIDAKIGVHPADYIQVSINDVGVMVEAIDPKKRENVDQYTYKGNPGVDVKPVDVSSSEPGAVEESKFKSDSVDPAALVSVINSAVKDSGVENAHIVAVIYERFFANQPEPKITATVQGARGTKVLQYDMSGKLLEVT